MKKLLLPIIFLTLGICTFGQTYNAAYIKALYAKYPVKSFSIPRYSNLSEWDNPFYKSIADLKRHMPICEYSVVTKEHRIIQEALYASNKKIRSGVFAGWFVVPGDDNILSLYGLENKVIGKPMSIWEVVYGHCGLCYVLAAWCPDGMFFSDAIDYNAAMEYQGQNIGTQIASEDTTRLLLGWVDKAKHKVTVVDTVQIWGGCYAGPNAKTVTFKGKTVTIPDEYWKIIKFGNQTVCYWMPNLVTENQILLSKRHITYANLVKNLGFDPEKIFPPTN